MAINETHLARVEAYLDGSMPLAERAGFLDEVKADPELEMAFDFQMSLVIATEQRQLREELAAEVGSQPREGWLRRLTPAQRPYLLAAAIAFLLLVGSIWYLSRPSPTQPKLALAESLAAPDLFLPSQAKGPSPADKASLDSLTKWRQTGAYDRIIGAYASIPLPTDSLWTSLATHRALALGIAYLHADSPQQDLVSADRYLRAVIRHSSDRSLRNYARRQQVLLSVKQGKLDQAKARLDTLAQGRVDPQQAVQRQAQEAQDMLEE